jgi:hypothetical protein
MTTPHHPAAAPCSAYANHPPITSVTTIPGAPGLAFETWVSRKASLAALFDPPSLISPLASAIES